MYVIVGILGLLIGLLFLFVRQKIYSFEHRLNLLSDTIQAIAGLNVQHTIEDEDEEDEDEDADADEAEADEDEAEEAEEEEEAEAEAIFQSFKNVNTINLEPLKFEFNLEHSFEHLKTNIEHLKPNIEYLEPNIEYLEPHLEHLDPIEYLEPSCEHLELSLDSKVITLERVVSDEIYEKMTVKELKEKVSEVDGPKFKTKKEMVDFLKSR